MGLAVAAADPVRRGAGEWPENAVNRGSFAGSLVDVVGGKVPSKARLWIAGAGLSLEKGVVDCLDWVSAVRRRRRGCCSKRRRRRVSAERGG